MAEPIVFEVTQEDDGGYSAKAIAADGAIFTQADTFEELRDMAADAVRCHFGEVTSPTTIQLVFSEELAAA